MSSYFEEKWKCVVEVRWPGKKKWSQIEDPGDYSLRAALEKCEIDGYRVIWKDTQPAIPF